MTRLKGWGRFLLLDVEDSEDVEIHHVLVRRSKIHCNLSQSLNNSLRNLEAYECTIPAKSKLGGLE